MVAIASSGVHCNGFSLVRKICFDTLGLTVDFPVESLGGTLGEVLLTPTRIYVDSVLSLIKDQPVHGLAHITGGGITENIVRVLPQACKVRIRKGSWNIPPVFTFLQEAGGVEIHEMHRTFNMGIGMIAVVPENATADVMDRLRILGEKAFVIGDVVQRQGDEPQVAWID